MQITLFSNGTAFICRDYQLAAGQRSKISIPVKKQYLDEVISSIDVLGDVSVPSPPSFQPVNAQDSSLTLNHKDIVRDLAIKLAGTRAEVQYGANKTASGILMGIQEFKRVLGDTIIDDFRVSLMDDKGAMIVADTVSLIRPLDASAQAEVTKALRACAQRIKPDNSLVDLEISNTSDKTAEATVAYSVPSAAWKTSYRLRHEENCWKLEGMAIVDNDTEEDWRDCMLSVVSGQPITFSTDLAESKIPTRSRVNVVSDNAIGAVECYDSESFAPMAAPAGGGRMSLCASPAMASATKSNSNARTYRTAERAEADHAEVGDFAIFSTKAPVTVEANRSAIVPMFTTKVDAKSVLYYSPSQNRRRPYRAIRFKNNSPYSLSRGVVTCFDEGTLMGKAVLDGLKQGEDGTVVHALETGVRVLTKNGNVNTRRSRIKIANGMFVGESVQTYDVTYTVKNSRDEAFDFEIEYKRNLDKSKVTATGAELTETSQGFRGRFTLPANGSVKVTFHEAQTQVQEVELQDYNTVSWLASQEPIKNSPALKQVLTCQEKVAELTQKIAKSEKEAAKLTESQERLKGLIPVADAEQANDWRAELAKNERSWRQINFELLPQMSLELEARQKDLATALQNLTVAWADEAQAEPVA